MADKNSDMAEKLEKTVDKTIAAIARIERFIIKYGPDLKDKQIERIANEIKKLQK